MSLKKCVSVICGFGLIISLLIASISLSVFDRSFYTDLYEKTDLAAEENISEDDLYNSLFMMLDYVQGKRDDLDGTIIWHQRVQPTFNEKEIAHMKDVRSLWQHARSAGWICFAVSVIAAIWLMAKHVRSGISWIAWGYLMAAAGFLIILTLLGLWMWMDFTGFWISFHHLFFSNNLWLLDPATDFMIVICPEIMFSSLITRILLLFVPAFLILAALSIYILKRKAPVGFTTL